MLWFLSFFGRVGWGLEENGSTFTTASPWCIYYILPLLCSIQLFPSNVYAHFFVHQSKNHQQTNDVENYVEYIINVKINVKMYTQHCNTMTPHQINGLNWLLVYKVFHIVLYLDIELAFGCLLENGKRE